MPNMSKEDKNPLLEQNSFGNKQYNSVEDQKEPLSDKKKLSENDNSLESKQNNKKQRFTSQQWATLITLAFGNFCIGASISLQAPFFPQEAEKKGATATEYGLVFGIYQLTMFLTAPFCGKMIALVTPSFMLNAGIFIIGVASILFGFLDRAPNGNPFVYLALAVRVAEGMGSAAAKTSSYAIIALEFPNSVAKTFSSLETCIGIGLIAGPTIGGALYEVGGYEIPFITAGVLLLIDGILVYFILPELDNSKIPRKSGNLFKFYKNIGIGLDFLVVFTTFNCIGFNQATLEPHLRQFNLTPFLLGSTFVISGAIYSITAPIWGWICDHLPSTKPITLLGCAFMVICELFLGPTTFLPIDTQLWLVFVSLSVFGLAIGCKLVPTFIGALRNTIERGFPNDLTSYGLVSSMFTSAMALGAFIGPTTGGYLLDIIGFRKGTEILFGIEMGLFVLVAVYFVSFRLKLGKTRPREPLMDSLTTAIIAEGVRTKSISV